ncbi:hypothetical protein HMPREF0693_1454 [Proteus mirabilis ATCC 29906]|nr:hypothetical protein HMPREF0693_1454 [Proteus mirabilis ATCC 29906]
MLFLSTLYQEIKKHKDIYTNFPIQIKHKNNLSIFFNYNKQN